MKKHPIYLLLLIAGSSACGNSQRFYKAQPNTEISSPGKKKIPPINPNKPAAAAQIDPKAEDLKETEQKAIEACLAAHPFSGSLVDFRVTTLYLAAQDNEIKEQDYVTELAKLAHEHWHAYNNKVTVEGMQKNYQRFTKRKGLACMFIMVDQGNNFVASLSLSKSPSAALQKAGAQLGRSCTLGAFHTIKKEQGKGVGTELASIAKELAKNLGYQDFWWETSNPKNVARYKKAGGTLVGEHQSAQHTKWIFKLNL